MNKKHLRSWKKVFESDLGYISYELKELVNTPSIIFLEGPLGAGKTTFSKVFIGHEETMSPTYSILYERDDILHGDFYRIKSREDIIQLELPLYLEDKNFFLVEWGKQHFYNISPELSEEIGPYLLEIELNSADETDKIPSRNFHLSRILD